MPAFAAIYDYDPAGDQQRGELLGEHRAWLAELDNAGTLLEAGVLPDRPGSIIAVVAADLEGAVNVFDADPYWRTELVANRAISEWNVRWGVVAAALGDDDA